MFLSFYVAAAQHVAGLTVKMNCDQQPFRAPNTSGNRTIYCPLPIIIETVHNMDSTRDSSCIPCILVRHEPDVVCVRITSDQRVRQTVLSPSWSGCRSSNPLFTLHNDTSPTRVKERRKGSRQCLDPVAEQAYRIATNRSRSHNPSLSSGTTS